MSCALHVPMSINGTPKFEMRDDGIIEYMHNINIMAFPDEAIRVNKQDRLCLYATWCVD